MAISEETIAGLRIDAGEVHVWTANLVGLQTYLTSVEGILNSRRAFCRSSGALSDTQEMVVGTDSRDAAAFRSVDFPLRHRCCSVHLHALLSSHYRGFFIRDKKKCGWCRFELGRTPFLQGLKFRGFDRPAIVIEERYEQVIFVHRSRLPTGLVHRFRCSVPRIERLPHAAHARLRRSKRTCAQAAPCRANVAARWAMPLPPQFSSSGSPVS